MTEHRVRIQLGPRCDCGLPPITAVADEHAFKGTLKVCLRCGAVWGHGTAPIDTSKWTGYAGKVTA